MERIFLGYDPGGLAANGVAALRVSPDGSLNARVATCDDVDEAVQWFRNLAGGIVPCAAGIDTYLSWATGRCGWRPMDTHLRKAYPSVQHSVFASNSAAGSMAVQGMAMAMRLRTLWPDMHLNEAHPKVVYHALTNLPYQFGGQMVSWLVSQVNATNPPAITNEHEWDALISAWATLSGVDGKWSTDLMVSSPGLLQPAGPVSYFWP